MAAVAVSNKSFIFWRLKRVLSGRWVPQEALFRCYLLLLHASRGSFRGVFGLQGVMKPGYSAYDWPVRCVLQAF